MSLDLSIAPRPEPRTPTFDLLPGGRVAFERILRRIDGARRRIFIRCFEWRDDETGNMVARHLLRAADRGVAVTVLKDRLGMHYEYLEATKQSFFHKKIHPVVRMQTWFLMAAYRQWGSLRQAANPLADALLSHENVRVICERRFDHSKLYIFDDDTMILGGMGIGDDFRFRNVDFMVEVCDAEVVARYCDRQAGRATFDPGRPFDFMLHSFAAEDPTAGESLAHQRLRFIASARHRLTVEMAYMGDRRFTAALLDAVRRGVSVTLLTAERASVIADLNRHICNQLLRRAGTAGNLRVVLHPRMVHGKAIVVDGERVDIGSANFTPLSHGAYEEVDLYCADVDLARAVERAIERDIEDGREVRFPIPYRRPYMLMERALSAYQARKRRPRTSADGTLS